MRVRQIAVFLIGAGALEVLVNRGDVRFYWTPLILGLTYLAAAVVGGRDGGHWSGATALTGFGLAVAWVGYAQPRDVDVAGVYVAGAGAAVAIGAAAAARGWPISGVSVGVTLGITGSLLALVERVPEFGDGRTYVEYLGLVIAGNVIAAALSLRRPAAP